MRKLDAIGEVSSSSSLTVIIVAFVIDNIISTKYLLSMQVIFCSQYLYWLNRKV